MGDCIGREQFHKDFIFACQTETTEFIQQLGTLWKSVLMKENSGKGHFNDERYWKKRILLQISRMLQLLLISKEMRLQHRGNVLHSRLLSHVEYLLRFGGLTTGLLTGSRHIRPHRRVEQHFCIPVQYWSAVHCPGHVPWGFVVGHVPWFDAAVSEENPYNTIESWNNEGDMVNWPMFSS